MIRLAADGLGNLLVMLGENHELDRLALAVHDIVEHEVLDNHRTETESHHRHSFQERTELRNEQTAADDDEIHENENRAQ